MKIALFTDTYDQINGVGNTFRKHLIPYCVEKNKELHVYTHSEGKDSAEELGSVKIFRYKPSIPIPVYFDMIFDLKIPRFRIVGQCKKERYELIHTATPGSMGLNALIVAHTLKIPLVGSYHTALPDYVKVRVEKIAKYFNLLNKKTGAEKVVKYLDLPNLEDAAEGATWELMKWYYDQCRLVLAPSEYTRLELQAKLKTKVDIFSRGIDTERFNPKHGEKHQGTDALYVGRVSIEKNLDTLVDIFKGRADVRLVIVGDGPYKEEMRQNLQNADLKGFLQGEELSRAYASSDLFVFPSTTDTFGNVVLEAMASGLPVVVTDRMGPKELVKDGETGFIAHGKDDFREKTDILVKDKKLREEMGRNARSYALSRRWDAVFKKLFEDYERAVKG